MRGGVQHHLQVLADAEPVAGTKPGCQLINVRVAGIDLALRRSGLLIPGSASRGDLPPAVGFTGLVVLLGVGERPLSGCAGILVAPCAAGRAA